MKKNTRGFTLVELMIVIGMIAFLAVLISAYLRTQIFKSYDARRKAEIKRISIAVEEYEKDNDCYPLPSALSCISAIGLRPYLDKVPCDPQTKASYYYEHEDSVCPRWYKIYAVLDNASDNDYVANIGPNAAYSFVYESPNAPATVPEEGGGGVPEVNFYGCFNGVCMPITFGQCEPAYQYNSGCYGACLNSEGQPQSECN